MTMEDSRFSRPGRRRAITLLGVGAGFGFLSAARPAVTLLAGSSQAAASGTRRVTFPRGAIIRTILKDLPPEGLAQGSTLFHEHLDGVYSRDTRQLKLPPPSSADITPVIADIKDAMATGVVCIVDGGHPDMGVNYEHLKEISRQTGLHVVASGGYYIQNTYPAEISTMSEDQIAESLIKEAAAGRYGAYGEIGDAIGHLDSLPGREPDIMTALARRGAFVGIDRIRGEAKADDDRVALILGFLEAGYADHLLLASDTRRDYRRVARFVKQLQAAGVSDSMLRAIQVDNPRKFLAFVPKKA
jgi:predicted metal-dependent phosphotriesterase family hydrolase